ncbi:MAG TPA: hypothetical protein VMN39_06245 [Longimicrobiaceae bacterium]|nr:hypothetical protein [Longimicrobiaceae bacterium]
MASSLPTAVLGLFLLWLSAAEPAAAQERSSLRPPDAERIAGLDGTTVADTVGYVEVINGRVLGGWSTWRKAPDTWGYSSDRR